jgi:hypothetical protein
MPEYDPFTPQEMSWHHNTGGITDLNAYKQAHQQTIFELGDPIDPEHLIAASEHALRYGGAVLSINGLTYIVEVKEVAG